MWESLVSNAHQVAPVRCTFYIILLILSVFITSSPLGDWYVKWRSYNVADQSWQEKVPVLTCCLILKMPVMILFFSMHILCTCLSSQLQSSLSSIEEQIGRQKQMLRESSAEHLTLLRHIKLVEDEANTTQYNGHVNHEATDSLQRYVCVSLCIFMINSCTFKSQCCVYISSFQYVFASFIIHSLLDLLFLSPEMFVCCNKSSKRERWKTLNFARRQTKLQPRYVYICEPCGHHHLTIKFSWWNQFLCYWLIFRCRIFFQFRDIGAIRKKLFSDVRCTLWCW